MTLALQIAAGILLAAVVIFLLQIVVGLLSVYVTIYQLSDIKPTPFGWWKSRQFKKKMERRSVESMKRNYPENQDDEHSWLK